MHSSLRLRLLRLLLRGETGSYGVLASARHAAEITMPAFAQCHGAKLSALRTKPANVVRNQRKKINLTDFSKLLKQCLNFKII